MAQMVLVSFLPFEVLLTIQSGNDRKFRKLLADAGSGPDPASTKILGNGNSSGTKRRDAIQINVDSLTDILELYFDDYLSQSFSDLSNINDTLWAPFSHVSLSNMRRRRHHRRGLQQDISVLNNNYNENDRGSDGDRKDGYGSSSESTLELKSESSVGRVGMEGVFNNESPLGMAQGDQDKNGKSVITLTRVKPGNLRRRNEMTTYLVAEQFSGVAIFNKDGDLPIPSNNQLQGHQLGALADPHGDLIAALSADDSGVSPDLGNVIAVSLSVALSYESKDPTVINNNSSNLVANQNGTPITGTNAVIVIAVAVAACSMCLLGFALYLAFRRRQQPDGMQNHTHLKEVSPNHHRSLPSTNDISPLTNGTHLRKGHGRHGDQKATPPVLEMQLHPHHDDAISEYTESVYSLPVTAGAMSRSNSFNATRDLTSRQRELLKDGGHEKPKVSNRFNPRYIISSKRSSNASDSDNEQSMAEFCGVGRGASQEMEGVPQLTTPMKEALRQQTQVNESNESSDVTPLTGISGDIRERAETAKKTSSDNDNNKQSSTNLSPSGLYPADVIDDDINSSLAGYHSRGANIGKSFRNYMGDDSTFTNNQNDNDGASLSSYESYGFSLDGADYSTVANSTKYGY